MGLHLKLGRVHIVVRKFYFCVKKDTEYTLDIIWQTACLVFNLIVDEGYAVLIS